MPATANSATDKYISNEMSACLKRFWGYTQFRPWQAETILAIPAANRSASSFPPVTSIFLNYFSEISPLPASIKMETQII